MKHKVLLTAALTLFAVLQAPRAQAQIDVGPVAGLNFGDTDLFVGGQIRFPVGAEVAGMPLFARPGIEFYPFKDPDPSLGSNDDFDLSLWVVNLDVMIPVNLSEDLGTYLGAGIYIARSSVSATVSGLRLDSDDTNAGLNIIGGTTFGDEAATLVPFGEAVLAIGNGTDGLLIRGGVLLRFGD